MYGFGGIGAYNGILAQIKAIPGAHLIVKFLI